MVGDRWTELAVDACTHAGVRHASIETLATWEQPYCQNAVYRLDQERYLKLFGPDAQRQFAVERCLLRTIEGEEAIPAPRILAEAERSDARPYLILTGAPGSTVEAVWDTLSRSEQLALARQVGTITRAMHRLPRGGLEALEQRYGGRSARIEFVRGLRVKEAETTESLSVRQRDDVLGFLRGEADGYLHDSLTVTHGDLTHVHFYVSRAANACKVSSVIDWADAMLGPPEWDVAFLWFWTFSRDRGAMRECLRALYPDDDRPERFARRCFAAMLHTYSARLLWDELAAQAREAPCIERAMTELAFPPEIFGPAG